MKDHKTKLSVSIQKWKAKGLTKSEALIKAKALIAKANRRWVPSIQETFDKTWRMKVKIDPQVETKSVAVTKPSPSLELHSIQGKHLFASKDDFEVFRKQNGLRIIDYNLKKRTIDRNHPEDVKWYISMLNSFKTLNVVNKTAVVGTIEQEPGKKILFIRNAIYTETPANKDMLRMKYPQTKFPLPPLNKSKPKNPKEQAYVDFLKKVYCPYYLKKRNELIKKETPEEILKRDKDIAAQEAYLIRKMGYAPTSSDLMRDGGRSVNRINEVMRLFINAIQEYQKGK